MDSKGISAIAPGDEDYWVKCLRLFVHRTDGFIKARGVIISKLYFSHPEGLFEKIKGGFKIITAYRRDLFSKKDLRCFRE